MSEDELYKEAMKKIDEMVEKVFVFCDDVAEENDYDRAWVLDRFRERFSKAKRKNL